MSTSPFVDVLRRPRVASLRHRLAAFGVLATSILTFAVAVAAALPGLDDPRAVAFGLTVDLAVVVPLFYWLLVVRGGAPRVTIVPVALVSLGAAGWILPAEHHGGLDLLEMVVLPAELGLLGYLAWRVKRAAGRTGGFLDVHDRLRAAAADLVGKGRVARILAFEASILYYAFASWRQSPPRPAPGELHFTHHRRVLYPALFWGVLVAGLALTVDDERGFEKALGPAD